MKFMTVRALLAVLLIGCGSSGDTGPTTVPPTGKTPGIQTVSGVMQDSAGAESIQPVVLEVRDKSGVLAPAGTQVTLTTRQRADDVHVDEVHFRTTAQQSFQSVLTLSVDPAGRVAFYTQLCFVAGPGRVAVSVPSLGLLDTARFVIVAASGSKVSLNPIVATVRAGASFPITAVVSDQFSNPRNDPITWTASGTGIAVTNGGVVTATAIGIGVVTAATSAGQSVTKVSVVPAGQLAAARSEIGRGNIIYTMDLDGSNRRELVLTNAIGTPARPAFIPGSPNIVYANGVNGDALFRVVDPNGVSSPFFTALPPTTTWQFEPTPSPDGRWLFFSAIDTRCGGTEFACLFRSRINGTGIEILGNALTPAVVNWRPGPSPDGSKVAYVTTGADGATIKVFDVATRTASSWGVLGQQPAWSPLGTSIAYVTNRGGPIMLMNTDGTGARRLTAAGYAYTEDTLGWSADGKWILAKGPSYLELIDAQTGVAMPLYSTLNMVSPTLR